MAIVDKVVMLLPSCCFANGVLGVRELQGLPQSTSKRLL